MSTSPESVTPARILIVEDEALIAEELRERLTRLGMTVVGVADSAESAVQAAAHGRPRSGRGHLEPDYFVAGSTRSALAQNPFWPTRP